MSTEDIRWISSSRMGSPEALAPFVTVLQILDEALAAYRANSHVLESLAHYEALVRTAFESLSPRVLAGRVFSEAVSELVGGYLTDSAHLLFHTNLRRMIDSYGIAPYLDDALARGKVSRDPVPTQFPLPYSADWFATQARRLGSSTLQGLEQPPLESGFKGWQSEVIDAFYDLGDFQRPSFPDSYEAGAMLITVQAVDPKELFDKYSSLIRMFTKKPAEIVGPQLGQFANDMVSSVDLTQMGSMAASRYLRPHLAAGNWSTSPDFVRASTQDVIPLVGDVLLDLRGASVVFGADLPSSLGLDEFAGGLADFAETFDRMFGTMVASLNAVAALMSQPGYSRLWIPVEAGGSARLVREIENAEASRRDVQRVVDGGFTGVSGYDRGEFIPYEDAVAAQALDASFRFKPAENMLVAGVVIVLNKGPLAILFENAFAPKQEDCDENDGGAPAYAGELFEGTPLEVKANSAFTIPGFDSIEAIGVKMPVDGARNPTDQARTGWTDAPIGNERPLGPTNKHGGPLSIRSRQPRATAFQSRDGVALQVVRSGTQRNTVLRRGDDVVSAPALGAETRGAATLPSGPMGLTRPTTIPTSTAPSVPWACMGARAPVGEAPASAEETPQSMLPMDPTTAEWVAYAEDPLVVDITVVPGKGTFTSAALDTLIDVSHGYAGPSSSMEDILQSKTPWWLDLVVEWATHEPGGMTTRSAALRVQVTEVVGAPGATVFTTVPALPSYPVVAASSYSDGVVWAGQALGLQAELAPRGGTGSRADFVEQSATGIVFESFASWRRSVEAEPDEGLMPTLQAHALGMAVDSDTGQVGRRRAVLLPRKTATGTPGLLYISAVHPTLDEWTPVHAVHPLPSNSLSTNDSLFNGDDFRPSPMRAAGDAWGRAIKPIDFPYYVLDPAGVSGSVTAEDYVSAQLPELTEDTRLLTVHVPRSVRVGLGTVSASNVEVPPGSQADTATIVTLDVASGIWIQHSDAVDPAALLGGHAFPTVEFSAAYAGVPWAVDLTWDTLSGAEVGAALIPTIRRSNHSDPLYGGKQILDPNLSDSFLTTPGSPIEARFGVGVAGDTVFAVAGRADGESAWVDLPQLSGTSRRSEAEQDYETSLTFVPLAPWTGRGATWTLLETASHLLVLRSGGPCYLEAFEKDLLTGDTVRRASVAIPDPVPGRRYQVLLRVEPTTSTVTAVWRQADDDVTEAAGYTDVVSDAQVVGTSDTYPYPRALDGYPLTGATIRVGRPLPPVLLEARLTVPYVDNLTVYIAGSPEQQPWAVGTPPLALLAVDAAPTP